MAGKSEYQRLLEPILASAQRLSPISMIEAMEKTIEVLNIRYIADAYMLEEFGAEDVTSLSHDQLHEMLLFINGLKRIDEPPNVTRLKNKK